MPQYTVTVEVLKFNKMVQATTGTSSTVVVCSHSQQALDFFVNVTRNTMPPIRYNGTNARRKIESVTTVSFTHTASISGQTKNDWIALYKFTDVTQYVCQNSVQISLNIQGDDTAQFEAIQTYTAPGYFLAFDGYYGTGATIKNTTLQWDISSKAWAEKTASGVNRYRHRVESISGLAYLLSGSNLVGNADVKSYDRSTDSFATLTDINFPRDDAESCAYNGKAWIFSGYSLDLADFLLSMESYNPVSDTWDIEGSFDYAFRGDGINICKNLMFVMYTLDKGSPTNTFNSSDYFIDLLTSTFATYFVGHTSPNRCNSKAGFKIDEYKCLSVGGSTTVDGFGTINKVTRINFLGKVYAESAVFPTNIQEGYCDQYEQYSIYACGVNWTGGVSYDTARCYNYLSDSWFSIANAPYDNYWGCATVV